MFNWKGYTNDASPNQWTATTKGFHMDSGATVAGTFEVGCCPFRTIAGIEGTSYQSIQARKFTFAPYLGFDGWNCYRNTRTNTDRYRVGRAGFDAGLLNGEFENITATQGTSDYYAYQEGIYTFRNPEAVNINVLATPGIDYSENNSLVGLTIDMVEEERADSVYILTSPEGVTYNNVVQLTSIGFATISNYTADDMVGLLEAADIDSNYTATYWPWIQSKDTENNVNVWLPPTYEVVRNIALTDNVSFPWFASAGYTRGLTSAIQARVKLTEADRDTLYEGRINPMATFSDQGVVIWGNKNLQIADSALDRLNIRRLLLQTRKLISAVAVRLLFEQNDQIVRNQFLSLVNPILENIKRERGLADFRVQLSSDPEEIDRNELRGKIFLKPVPALEFIILEFNVTSTGASFDNL
jgi:phage tail sheath protein FI